MPGRRKSNLVRDTKLTRRKKQNVQGDRKVEYLKKNASIRNEVLQYIRIIDDTTKSRVPDQRLAEECIIPDQLTYHEVFDAVTEPGPSIICQVEEQDYLPTYSSTNELGICRYEYIPLSIKSLSVNVLFAKKLTSESPFSVLVNLVIDVKEVRVIGCDINDCKTDMSMKYEEDVSGVPKAALELDLVFDRNPLLLKPDVRDYGDNSYDVFYKVDTKGLLLTLGVLHNGEHISNSPFEVKVRSDAQPEEFQTNHLVATTFNDGIFASIPTEFTEDIPEVGSSTVRVSIMDPNNDSKRCLINILENNKYKVRFNPDDCGLHTITVRFSGHNLSHPSLDLRVFPDKADIDVDEKCIKFELLP